MLNIAVVLMDSIFLMRLGHLFLTAVCLRRSDERVFAKDTGRLKPGFRRPASNQAASVDDIAAQVLAALAGHAGVALQLQVFGLQGGVGLSGGLAAAVVFALNPAALFV